MTMPMDATELDPTSRLIIEEARTRGIAVEILAPRAEYFRLRHGDRTVLCRESLSELTSAVALSRCDDKRTTAALLQSAGLRTPAQIEAGKAERDLAFLREHKSVVVKPARGEQGRGVSVGIRTSAELAKAIERAAIGGGPVLIEQAVQGEDLRIIVIGEQIVAAAVRRPPRVTGDGKQTVAQLIAAQSARRQRETGGESKIPLDDETRRCVADAGHTLEDVLPAGRELTVRGAANLHMGGTISDVTDQLSKTLADAACAAARVLEIPVIGLDMIVPSLARDEYWILEANERPGLANHEPQPTAARFVDLLFPKTAAAH
jgi:GNAT-family acetyltransferase (TIGR03103 family)